LFGKVTMLQWLGGIVIAFLTTLGAGGAALYHHVTGLRTDLEIVKRDTADLITRTKAVQSQLDRSVAAGAPVLDTLKRIETRLAVAPPNPGATILSLNAAETDLLKTAFLPVMAKWSNFVDARYTPGDPIKTPDLQPIPDAVWQKVPAVKGLQFTFDEKRNLLLVSSQGTRVLAVIPPG
jgi:hypothetical protein